MKKHSTSFNIFILFERIEVSKWRTDFEIRNLWILNLYWFKWWTKYACWESNFCPNYSVSMLSRSFQLNRKSWIPLVYIIPFNQNATPTFLYRITSVSNSFFNLPQEHFESRCFCNHENKKRCRFWNITVACYSARGILLTDLK